MNEYVKIVFNAHEKGHKNVFRLSYLVGLSGGYTFDFLALITGKSFPKNYIITFVAL